jgi:hypothetical protein
MRSRAWVEGVREVEVDDGKRRRWTRAGYQQRRRIRRPESASLARQPGGSSSRSTEEIRVAQRPRCRMSLMGRGAAGGCAGRRGDAVVVGAEDGRVSGDRRCLSPVFFFRYSRTRRGGPEKGADGEVFEGRPPAWPHDKQGSNSVEGSLADNVRRGCPDEPRRKSPVDGASATDQVGGDAAADGSHKPGGNSICTRGAAEAIRRILAGGRPGPAQGWWIVRGIVCGSRGAGGEWEASRHVSVAGGGCRDDD